MNKETSLYIKADPFTFNEMDIVTKAIDSFGYIHIILDRMNRDQEFGAYTLSYQDRADIINYEMKRAKISQYDIIPVDISVQNTLITNNIGNIILNYDQQKEDGFRMFNLFREILNGIDVILMNGEKFVCNDMIRKLILSDETMQKYKRYCFDYSFGRMKLKSTYKIALTGDSDDELDLIQRIFEERGVQIVNADDFLEKLPKSKTKTEASIGKELNKHIANTILGSFNQKIVVRGKKLFEYGADKLFNSTIYASDCSIPMNKDGISDHEKKRLAEHVIDFRNGNENAINQTIKLYNQRYLKV